MSYSTKEDGSLSNTSLFQPSKKRRNYKGRIHVNGWYIRNDNFKRVSISYCKFVSKNSLNRFIILLYTISFHH